ncbi:MAG: cutinase family protein [Acidimicrobiia bacterium]
MIVAIALVAALLAPLSHVQSDCVDTQVVGVRGSGQSGYGEQVEAVVDGLVPALLRTGRSVAVEALDYPAISISDSFGLVLLTGDYDRSVATGVTELESRLDAISTSCPLTDIVLIGYSQGAQVIKTALEDSLPRHRLASVVLLADPTRSEVEAAIRRLGDATAERAGAFGSVLLPSHVRAVVVDVCAAGDGICERGRRDLQAHVDGYVPLAAEVVAAAIAEVAEGTLRYLAPR